MRNVYNDVAAIDLFFFTVVHTFGVIAIMNIWIVFGVGLIIGWLIGFIAINQNFETCRNRRKSLEKQLSEHDVALQEANHALSGMQQALSETQARLQSIS